MSIAELIMTGTERASKSTDWVADSLAKIGDNVSKVLTEREQNRQAQEMLPFLKQNLQAAMTDAQNGKPGQAYSKLLGSLDIQTLNNPQLANLVKLGFNAINQTMDAQKTGGTSLVDAYILNQLSGGKFPIGGGGVGGEVGGGGTPSDALNSTTPLPETANQAGGAIMNPVVEEDLPPWTRPTKPAEPAEPMVSTQPPSATAAAAKPTPAQEKSTEFVQQNQKVAETQGAGKAWYNQAIDPASPKLKEISQTHRPIDLTGGDILGFGTMYFPIEEDKEINITGRGQDFNFSQTRNRRDPKLIEQRREFYNTMDTSLAKVNDSWEVQTLLDQYGSVSNFPKNKNETTGLVFPLKEKKDGKSSITFKKGTGLIEAWTALQSAPGMGRELGILIARSGEMPAVGAGRDIKSLEGKIGTDPKTGKQFKIVNGQPVPL